MCQQSGVSRSGDRAWRQRPESERHKVDPALTRARDIPSVETRRGSLYSGSTSPPEEELPGGRIALTLSGRTSQRER
jgi:hypothetical protein